MTHGLVLVWVPLLTHKKLYSYGMEMYNVMGPCVAAVQLNSTPAITCESSVHTVIVNILWFVSYVDLRIVDLP